MNDIIIRDLRTGEIIIIKGFSMGISPVSTFPGDVELVGERALTITLDTGYQIIVSEEIIEGLISNREE